MRDNFPDVVRIETSGKCNFRCKHCCNGQNPPDRDILTKEMFDIIYNQFTEHNFIPHVVVLYHGGEPLLNKNLFEYIKKLKSYGVQKIKIVTNAALLTKQKAEELIDAGLTDIDFSFDGISPEENNMIRVNGNFEKDSENVIYFLQFCKEKNYKINAKICNVQICTEEQLNQYKNDILLKPAAYILEKFKDYADMLTFDVFPAMVWPGYDIKTSNYNAVNCESNSKQLCSTAFETFTICSNGDVVPCCYDIKGNCVFGNVTVNNIFEIWNNQKYVEFRENMKNCKLIDMCKKCLVYNGNYLTKT